MIYIILFYGVYVHRLSIPPPPPILFIYITVFNGFLTVFRGRGGGPPKGVQKYEK